MQKSKIESEEDWARTIPTKGDPKYPRDVIRKRLSMAYALFKAYYKKQEKLGLPWFTEAERKAVMVALAREVAKSPLRGSFNPGKVASGAGVPYTRCLLLIQSESTQDEAEIREIEEALYAEGGFVYLGLRRGEERKVVLATEKAALALGVHL
jgi:hypothetical protein